MYVLCQHTPKTASPSPEHCPAACCVCQCCSVLLQGLWLPQQLRWLHGYLLKPRSVGGGVKHMDGVAITESQGSWICVRWHGGYMRVVTRCLKAIPDIQA